MRTSSFALKPIRVTLFEATDEDNKNDDDETVADHQCQDDGRRWNDRREAGKNEECRQSEEESRADDDNSKAASWRALIQQRRPARIDRRRSRQIREPRAAKHFAQRRASLAPPWQTGNDVAQLRRGH
jgi:hypothetical protein